ncbi:phage major capsid protein [Solirubrobacter phytolaccae]|uniref:Phage major capsid protein n=1 Tax=Solirubrobacter phytolaccae TaxID=1404360 RepID=A0A9X3N3Q2_9ACTN|nr:phage major capsid protein [Solirubrobacter phytolaccae]MDA0179024.1 phage major capsid protein [Solirubrobacter phytolaccae]
MTDVRQRAAAARTARKDAREERDEAKADFEAASHDGPVTDWPEFKRMQRAGAKFSSADAEVEMIEDEERFLLEQVGGVARSFSGESFLNDPRTLEVLEATASSSAPIGNGMRLGIGVARDDLVAMLGQHAGGGMMAATPGIAEVGDGGRHGRHLGVREQMRRPLTLLDLFPSAPMDGNMIEYLQETGELDVGAAETAEGAVKPQGGVDLLDAEARARTIAEWVKVKRQQLADVAALGEVLRNRLTYKVLRRLERQIVNGDGLGENIKGIMKTTGVAEIAYNASELAADQALEGLVAVMLKDARPDFIALNPRDWADMLKAKTTGSGEYFSGGPFVATAERLWNTPALPVTGVASGSALVGDAARGATVWVREGVQVLASDSDQDDFVRNRVTLLGEGRFALSVWEPAAFAVVRFKAP